MLTLWIIIGCLFMVGIGMRFTYKVLGLTTMEASMIYFLIVGLTFVNSAPVRVIIGELF